MSESIETFCCVPYFMSFEAETSRHAMNCPRHCTDEQHRAIIERLRGVPLAMYGIEYPTEIGNNVLIHDPNARAREHPEETYTIIHADGSVEYSETSP